MSFINSNGGVHGRSYNYGMTQGTVELREETKTP